MLCLYFFCDLMSALGAWGKDICVDNTLKDNPKPAWPLRRPIESRVTAVPTETMSRGKCETPRQHAFKISRVRIGQNGNIHGERGEQVHGERAKEWTDCCLTNIVRRGQGAVVFSLLTST